MKEVERLLIEDKIQGRVPRVPRKLYWGNTFCFDGEGIYLEEVWHNRHSKSDNVSSYSKLKLIKKIDEIREKKGAIRRKI